MTDDDRVMIVLLPDPRPEFNHTYTRDEWYVLVDCGHGDRMFWGDKKIAADSMVAKGYMTLSTQFFADGRYLVTDLGWKLLDWK
jgi:hypothetical protein